MTFTELKSEVAALGFESRHYLDSQIAALARRAQSTVFSDRGVTKTVKIFIPSISASYKLESFVHKGGACDVINLQGASFSIELCGAGTVTINDSSGSHAYTFDSDKYLIKAFIKGRKGSLTLEGEHSFFIVRLLVFSETYGSSTDSIPDTEGRVINTQVRDSGDFLCFCALPCDRYGNPCTCICMEDGTVTFPCGTHGEFYLTYRRAPIPVNPDLSLEPIDIPKQCEHLLTLLTAAYMCLEYDAEQAAQYQKSYEKQMAELNRSSSSRISNVYRDITGWA